jgi:hypothetical protein
VRIPTLPTSPRPFITLAAALLATLTLSIAPSAQAAVAPCGPAWTQLPAIRASNGDYEEVEAIAGSGPTDVWAVGIGEISGSSVRQGFAAHFDGTSWTQSALPPTGFQSTGFSDVAVISPTDVWAVGEEHTNYPQAQGALVMHFNGTAWSTDAQVSGYAGAWSGVDAAGPNDVWLAGYDDSGSQPVPMVAHFDGNAWTTSGAPGAGAFRNGFTDVLNLGSGDAWAVGMPASWTTVHPLADHWNGATWSRVDTPPVGPAHLWGVDGTGPANVWAVGGTSYPSSKVAFVVLHWNGVTWRAKDVTALNQMIPVGSSFTLATDVVTRPLAHDAWLVGSAYTNHQVPLVGRLVNGSWMPASTTGLPSAAWLSSVTNVRGQVWTAGSSTTSAGNGAPVVARICPS